MQKKHSTHTHSGGGIAPRAAAKKRAHYHQQFSSAHKTQTLLMVFFNPNEAIKIYFKQALLFPTSKSLIGRMQ
jgi:hypothetical protein